MAHPEKLLQPRNKFRLLGNPAPQGRRSSTPCARNQNMRATPAAPMCVVDSNRLEKLPFTKNTRTFSWNRRCSATHELATQAPHTTSTPSQQDKNAPCSMCGVQQHIAALSHMTKPTPIALIKQWLCKPAIYDPRARRQTMATYHTYISSFKPHFIYAINNGRQQKYNFAR